MMRIVSVILTLYAFSLFSSPFALAQDKTISVSVVGVPLRLILKDISGQTGTALKADKFLSEKKFIVVAKEVAESLLLKQIAEAAGAQIARTVEGGVPHLLFKRRDEVSAWYFRYNAARQYARRSAVRRLTDRIYAERMAWRETMRKEEALKTAESPAKAEAKGPAASPFLFIRLFPNRVWRSYSQAQAEGWADPIGILRVVGADPVASLPFSELKAEDQSLIHSILSALPQERRRKSRDDSEIVVQLKTSFGLGEYIEVAAQKPGEEFPTIGLHQNIPIGAGALEPERLSLEHEELALRLGDMTLPLTACLGFTVEKDGTCKNPVTLDRRAPTENAAIKAEDWSRAELLTELGKRGKRNIVSDYYTDDVRLEKFEGKSGDYLTKAAQRFHCVFQEKEGFLLSCVTNAAEQDELEAPYPLFEQCIEWNLKQRGKPSERGLLPIDLYLSVCALPREQYLKIARYDDKKTGVNFTRFVMDLSFDNSGYPWYVRYGLLKAPFERLISPGGLPFAEASPELQRSVRTDIPLRAFLNRPIPANAILKLHYLTLPKSVFDIEAIKGYWSLDLLTPGEEGGKPVEFSVSQIYAQPPDGR